MASKQVKSECLPLYQQIMEDIKARIENGTYPNGSKIAGEQELGAEYGVSRITVRHAVSKLCAEGYLIKRQGVGTFVGKPRIHRLVSSITSFSESCTALGMTPSYLQKKLIIVPSRPDERAFLHLGEDGKLIYTSRILYADGVPIMLENCFYPHVERFAWILETPLDQPLYPLLSLHGIYPVKGKRMLEIVPASPEMSAEMQTPNGAPMFYKNAYLQDKDGQPLFIERSYVVGSRYVFDISIS